MNEVSGQNASTVDVRLKQRKINSTFAFEDQNDCHQQSNRNAESHKHDERDHCQFNGTRKAHCQSFGAGSVVDWNALGLSNLKPSGSFRRVNQSMVEPST